MNKHYFLNTFNNISIRNKLLLSYVLVVFIPVLFVGLILTSSMKKMALDRAINEASTNVERVNNRIHELMRVPMKISNWTSLDNEFKFESFVANNYKSTLDFFIAYYDFKEFDKYLTGFNEIEDISFYSFNKSILNTGQFIKITKNISDTEWFQDILKDKAPMKWEYIYNPKKMDFLLYLISYIKAKDGKPLGVLTVGMNRSYLHDLLENEPFDIMVINDGGYIVTSKNTELTGKKINDVGLGYIHNMNKGIGKIRYNGVSSMIILRDLMPVPNNNSSKFRIVSVFPVNDIESKSAQISRLSFFIIAVSLSLTFIFIFIFSSAISKRVKNISNDMHRVASGNFNFTPTIEGKDEIGELSRDLETMVRSINELIHEVYEVNLQKKQLALNQKEIKFKMLANQINPHFLFNSLESIRMKAHCKGETEIAEVVKLLGKIMRKNLSLGNEKVTLESEIELIRNYLDIQKFRYGNKINYIINFDEELKDYKILPLIIQPIVENAVIHGLENKRGEGLIKVDIINDNESIKISVMDNGIGMDLDRLSTVRNTLNESDDKPGEKIGLKNVQQRIKLCYGEEYGIKINSEVNLLTQIDITLPGKSWFYAESIDSR